MHIVLLKSYVKYLTITQDNMINSYHIKNIKITIKCLIKKIN